MSNQIEEIHHVMESLLTNNQITPEKIKSAAKTKRVYINDFSVDVKYFNKTAPVKQLSSHIVSNDGTVSVIPKKPISIVIRQRIRKMLDKRCLGLTTLQWIGKICHWTIFGFTIFVLLYLVYVCVDQHQNKEQKNNK